MNPPDKRLSAGSLARMRHSIRTRYAATTAFFLLFILTVFYVGGRIMLVHLVKSAEEQVRSIGTSINTIAQRDARNVQDYVSRLAPEDLEQASPTDLLGQHDGLDIALAIQLSPSGEFKSGYTHHPGDAPSTLPADTLSVYFGLFPQWIEGQIPTGLLKLNDQAFNVAAVRRPNGELLILGIPFNPDAFAHRLTANFSGTEFKISQHSSQAADTPSINRVSKGTMISESRASEQGLGSFVSVAMDFYSQGLWKLGDNAFEAVYTIRDIAGAPVSTIAVSLPQTFSNAAGLAITRLTIFVAMVGIIFVLPIFWFQSRMLLNPLSRMTDCVRRAKEHCGEADSPRLDWKGDDEFADLAFSVNSLLETITNRTLAIAQVENRQKALINGLPDGLMIFDRSHLLVSIIKQPDDIEPVPGFLEGSPIDVTIFGRDGVEDFGKAVDAAFATERPQSLHLECGPRPHTRWFDVRLSLTDKMFVLAIVRDITETVLDRNRRRAAENRLQHVRKQESLTLLAGSIAHDVNNILAAVLNTVEITFMDAQDPEVVDALTTIRDAVKRGSAMTRELMTFAGETKFAFQRSDPSQLVRDAQRLAEGVISGNVQIHYNLPADLPAVDADPDQIWKVFFNLVKNASEAMDGFGEIRVSARRFDMTDDNAVFFISSSPLPAGPGVLITFTDNGPGIPKDMLRRIFDPYVSTKSSGRGFGLATVTSIIDAHHGGIRVESQVGQGTTFGIFLPVSRIAVVRAVPPRPDAPASVTSDSTVPRVREILLVDDDPAILKTTGILLQALKCSVHTATNQAEAAEIFRRRAHHLTAVILDAHLNSSDSVRLAALFRATAANVPIIVSSGSAPEVAQTIFASQPYDSFLAKPYTMSDIRKVIDSVAELT